MDLEIHNGEASPKGRVLSVSQDDEARVEATASRARRSATAISRGLLNEDADGDIGHDEWEAWRVLKG
jgi:hypothetical protein